MRVIKALLMAMALAAGAAACSVTPNAPSALPAASASSYELIGQVLDGGGAGLAGVNITLSKGDEERQAVTDGEGKFRIADLEPGDWTVSLKRKDYEDRTVSVMVNGNLTISFDMISVF
jgi:Zn-dependent alcohol dehydrogenase